MGLARTKSKGRKPGVASLRKAGVKTGGLDGLTRNGRTTSAGITGRLQPERVDGLSGIRTLGAVVSSSSGKDAARPTKLAPFKACVLERMKKGVLDAVRIQRGDRPQGRGRPTVKPFVC